MYGRYSDDYYTSPEKEKSTWYKFYEDKDDKYPFIKYRNFDLDVLSIAQQDEEGQVLRVQFLADEQKSQILLAKKFKEANFSVKVTTDHYNGEEAHFSMNGRVEDIEGIKVSYTLINGKSCPGNSKKHYVTFESDDKALLNKFFKIIDDTFNLGKEVMSELSSKYSLAEQEKIPQKVTTKDSLLQKLSFIIQQSAAATPLDQHKISKEVERKKMGISK